MRLYLDSSAIVPLFLKEPGSPRVRSLWDQADDVVTVRASYVEVRAALARAHRQGRTTTAEHGQAVSDFTEYWSQFYVVEIDTALALEAGTLAEKHGLRGYDAIQLAAATSLDDPALVVTAGDTDLLEAAAAEQLHVTNSRPS